MQYNAKTNQYEDDDGNVIELAALLLLIDRLTNATKRQAKLLASKLADGAITFDQWQASMLSLLKSAHITAAATGRGGLDRLTAKDWQRIEKKVTWQASYLPRFGRAIVAGAVVGAVLLRRAGSYASSPFISFSDARLDAQKDAADPTKPMMCRLVQNSKEGCEECTADADAGWMPVDEMGEIGSRICQDYCLCIIEFEDEI